MARVSTQRKNQENALAPQGQQQHPMDLFRRQFDALFDHMWSGMVAPFGQDFGAARLWDFGVTENDKEVTVRAEVPGFDEKELDVRLEQNQLTIRAEKDQKSDGQQEYRSFYRSVTLPAGIDPEQVEASYRNGVLELHIPRHETAQGKRIPIQGQQAKGGQQALSHKNGNGQEGQKTKPQSQETPPNQSAAATPQTSKA